MNRRQLLQNTGQLGIGLVASQFSVSSSRCVVTPTQTEGPFYPLTYPVEKDADLTYVTDPKRLSKGEIIWIRGKVLTCNGDPLPKTIVEIWQACVSGRYNHDYDPNPGPVDPHFQYWGVTTTDTQGNYAFRTIKPGGYPVTKDWQRPPHIHFKVQAANFSPLITQLYFAEEKTLNQKDRIIQRIAPNARSLVITSLKKTLTKSEREGQFNIILGTGNKVTPHLGT
ncbi:MAG: intradiol ring-cleavage dioxygenase [Microcystaceae cyanobacterium]